jgi:tetratricopeptide (TPR) repeat protein
VQEYRAVLAADPKRPGIHYRTGRALLARARQPDSPPNTLAEAAQEFELELQIDPTNANASYELGELQRKANRLDEAQRLFHAGRAVSIRSSKTRWSASVARW